MPNEPKFKRGQTVKILHRNLSRNKRWENTNAGGYGIIMSFEHLDPTSTSLSNEPGESTYEDENLYELWLLFEDGQKNRTCGMFEEKYLELYCSNEDRGLKVLLNRQRYY